MPSLRKKIETRSLHNTEMKKLVRVLKGIPSQQIVKSSIKDLPRRLRHSFMDMSSNLCHTHQGLDHELINEIWDWLKHEFEDGIGRFIYPVIMSGNLESTEELQIRQLEPVLEMWRPQWQLEASAPPARAPIHCGTKWKYDVGQCSACMLARIGEDANVLFALYAGMIGRFNRTRLMSRRVSLDDLTVAKLENPKSKRVRLVRYWLKASENGDALLYQATELGIKLKKMHKEWVNSRRTNRQNIYDKPYNIDGNANILISEDPFHDDNRIEDRSHYTLSQEFTDSKIGPNPRPHHINLRTSLESLGLNSPAAAFPMPTPQYSDPNTVRRPSTVFSDGRSTLRPNDSQSMVAPSSLHIPRKPVSTPYISSPTRPAPGAPGRSKRHDSPAEGNPYAPKGDPTSPRAYSHFAPTILSYDGGSGGAFGSFDALATPQERLEKYKNLLNTDGLPKPQVQSMYYGYGAFEGVEDPFADADEGSEDEGECVEREDRQRRGTHWEDLYGET